MSRLWLPPLLPLLLAACATRAADLSLVRVGDAWRWFKGRSEPSTPPTAWRAPDFEDSAWPSSPSGFTFDAWGYEATTFIEPIRDYSSVYFRRQFTVAEPSQVRWLVLRIDWDGGFVAYLNGFEVVRRGLGQPGVEVAFDAAAEFRFRGSTEEIDLSSAIPLLRAGRNTLAIQWHNSVPLYGGVGLVPELLANFTRGPVVQNLTPHSVQIVWKTPVPADTQVEYGPTAALGWRYSDTNRVTTHLATLDGEGGLRPNTVYHYRVGSRAGEDSPAAWSPPLAFRTFAAAGPLSFAVTADVGLGSVAQYNLAHVMGRLEPDLVLLAGDAVYSRFRAGLADFRFFSVYRPHMARVPYYVAAGNHDTVHIAGTDFFEAFFMPTNSVAMDEHQAAGTGPEHYYSFDHGDAHFVALYVPLMWLQHELKEGSAQLRWLERDLAASMKPWKFLFLHHPVMSSGPHGGDDYSGNGVPDTVDLARLLLPLAQRYGVQAIFSGHDHNYERFNPTWGVYPIVTGGGGGNLYYLTQPHPASAQFQSRYHVTHVRVRAEELVLEAVDEQGQVFDSMFIQRIPPPPTQRYAATHHTPVVEAMSANDGDGNILDQRFDFRGDPIPTVSGDFANLGRVYVNYDATHLYVGFEQVKLYSGQDLFLFIESPGLPGVTNLVGLGNGLLDPDGLGADALDFLENLAFANFTPNVACILGDEFADATSRAFRRTNVLASYDGRLPLPGVPTQAPLAGGQGVFRLDAELTSLPGARLQQYNRSPQSAPVPTEQNANFIELALPLAELRLTDSDRLKLGAVVGNGPMPGRPITAGRALDRAFLGYRLEHSGEQTAVLEGIVVGLGGPPLELRAERRPNGALWLGWSAVIGRAYTLEQTDALGQPFRNIDSHVFPRAATAREEHYEDGPRGPIPSGSRFYRIRGEP